MAKSKESDFQKEETAWKVRLLAKSTMAKKFSLHWKILLTRQRQLFFKFN